MPRPVLLVSVALVILSSAGIAVADEYAFFVARAGDDTSPGTTVGQPFRTLTRARDAFRDAFAAATRSPATESKP